MTYAVIYHSQTGNTKQIAEEIYRNISSEDKCICDMRQIQAVPDADVYFIGFSIRNGTCGIETMNYLDRVKGGKIALFATCGFYPAEQYREQLEHNLMVWIPDNAEYLGIFLCQGKVPDEQWQKIKQMMPEASEQLEEMLQSGSSHPNTVDFAEAAQFTNRIQQSIEDGISNF